MKYRDEEIDKQEKENKYLEEEMNLIHEKMKLLEEENFENLNIANTFFEELEDQDIKMIYQAEEIEELKSENNKLKERIQQLEDLHIKSTPKWNTDCDEGWRIDPETGKPDQHLIPKKIDKDKMNSLNLSDDLKWVSFKYEDENYKNKEFKIPRSLAEQLKIISPLINPKNKDEIEVQKIKNPEDIKEYLEEREINTKLEYWDSIINFLSFHRYSEFETKDFMNCYKFGNPETARMCINKLIEIGLIGRVRKGVYKVFIQF
jgi:hypothetical protein